MLCPERLGCIGGSSHGFAWSDIEIVIDRNEQIDFMYRSSRMSSFGGLWAQIGCGQMQKISTFGGGHHDKQL
jgi:hypothetical protein